MGKRYAMRHLVPAAALAALLAGCAVMTVDVDVYKGPLANHEDVQTQQFANLAVAAKPLLIQLRDNLEWYPQGHPRAGDPRIKGGDSRSDADKWYDPDWVPDHFDRQKGIAKSRFTELRARLVNNILSLYKDQQISLPDNFVARTRLAVAAYQNAWDILRPTEEQKKTDEKVWKLFRKEIDEYSKGLGDKIENSANRQVRIPVRL